MIRIGIFGISRGLDYAKDFMHLDCEIVAICERRKSVVDAALKVLPKDVKVYDNFDEFIEHDMDAVVLANFFHEHTPYAIKCFERGLHVFSECMAASTMAECVELLRAFEKYKDRGSIYMFAENYPKMKFNREMKKVVEGGTLGKILYAEGEYNHPGRTNYAEAIQEYNYFDKHWRNFLPRTYYLTHSLGPIMWLTGATPKRVSAFATFAPPSDDVSAPSHSADKVASMLMQNDDGSVFRIVGNAAFGGRHDSYRVCGTLGQVENLRGMEGKVMLRYSPWACPEGMKENNLYAPYFEDSENDFVRKCGHGGADYFTAKCFLDAIKENKQPEFPFDIYSGVIMAEVSILAHRSVLEGGMPYDIPDLCKEEERAKWENDHSSPFYHEDGREPTIPCCSHPDYKPSEKNMEIYHRLLEEKPEANADKSSLR